MCVCVCVQVCTYVFAGMVCVNFNIIFFCHQMEEVFCEEVIPVLVQALGTSHVLPLLVQFSLSDSYPLFYLALKMLTAVSFIVWLITIDLSGFTTEDVHLSFVLDYSTK